MNNLLAIPAILESGMLKIATIDIAVFIILIIALLIGFFKGFMAQILSFLGFFASLVLAIIFCGGLADFVFEKVPFITDGVKGMISSMIGSVLGDNLSTKEALISALSQTKIPAFLHEIIASAVVDSNFTIQIVDVLTKWALTVICFIALIIVLNIVFALLKKFLRFITELPIINVVDKTLGMAFSALKALLWLVIIVSILSLFVNVNQYLVPREEVTSLFNRFMEFIINIPFIKNIFS